MRCWGEVNELLPKSSQPIRCPSVTTGALDDLALIEVISAV